METHTHTHSQTTTQNTTQAAGVSEAAGGGEAQQDNAYDKAGFLSFMEFGGFDLRQDGVY